MTGRSALREAIRRDLCRYRVIILDEARPSVRFTRTYFLFGISQGLLRGKRKNSLRIVIMSATLNAAAFSSFFDSAPVPRIEGRQHPVRVMYTFEPQPDYVDAIITALLQIHLDQVVRRVTCWYF